MLASRLLHVFEFLISDIALYMLIRCSNVSVPYLGEKILELLKWDFQAKSWCLKGQNNEWVHILQVDGDCSLSINSFEKVCLLPFSKPVLITIHTLKKYICPLSRSLMLLYKCFSFLISSKRYRLPFLGSCHCQGGSGRRLVRGLEQQRGAEGIRLERESWIFPNRINNPVNLGGMLKCLILH